MKINLKVPKKINKYQIDVLYLADSLGSMNPIKIKNIFEFIKGDCDIPLGIHTHDNLGLALSNSLAALDYGAEWVDSTILGMGRGPGNCKTEEILIELNNSKGLHKISPIIEIISKHFLKLKNLHKWGTNPYYYIGGKFGIHPSYIQEIMNDKLFSPDDKLALIEKLKNKKAYNYSPEYSTSQIIEYDLKKHHSNFEPKNLFFDRKILILATGPSSEKYSDSIEIFINKTNPIVIALNTPSPISNNLINYRSACHPLRILTDGESYENLNQTIICPYSMLKSDIELNVKNTKILDYGIYIQSNNIKFMKNYCAIPNPLVLFYTIACVISGGAKSIAITGVDGYENGDIRNELNNNLFKLFREQINDKIPIFSITPSKYKNLDKKSIFGF